MSSANLRKYSRPSEAASSAASRLAELIERGRAALARYDYEEAVECFSAALPDHALNAEQRATLSCLKAEALENMARYRDAIETLADYEQAEHRASLHAIVVGKVYLRLGSAYGYAADRPKGISYVKSALALAEERDDIAEIGACHQVLGRIYRTIGETQFAREHFQQALHHHRLTGDKVAIAYAYHGLAMVSISEGDFKSADDYHEQALRLLDDSGPPLLFGHIYTNSAVILLLQEQGQEKEAVEFLQRATHYFERARNKRLLAATYTNLGFNLLHLGEMQQARQSLENAITLAREIGERVAEGNSLETLGELAMISGEFAEAERLAHEGINVLQQVSGRWVESQAYLTLGRCHLLQKNYEQAAESFQHSVQVAGTMEDHRGQLAAQLWLADTSLEAGDTESAGLLLDDISGAIEKLKNTGLIGHLRELAGRLTAAEGRMDEAVNILNQAVSIFEMVSNRYRTAIARYHLGRVYLRVGDIEKARTEFDQARATFLKLEAAPMLARTDAALESFNTLLQRFMPASAVVEQRQIDFAVASNAALLRLTGAASSRELLLHELTQIIAQELNVAPVIVYEAAETNSFVPVIWQGCDEAAADALREEVIRARQADKARLRDAALYELSPGNQSSLALYVGRIGQAVHPPRQFIEPLLRLAEMGLELCALRNLSKTIAGYETSAGKKNLELPGMVYQSAAMRELVDEITRIRSSNVTVLVTGESGTGKEVIARAIHQLSDRRDAPFVAFNCTIAPKEIIDSQLFGHRRGAFTGANNDYQGVIRSAAGGTLFLDEIGDLALDVQPKLLRFLQEGEIQPLGETKPIKVTARVVAATNCDLEKLVAEGRFREDLFYRLNVIRLHMPPLRERRDEIPALVTHFIARYSTQEHKQDITITPQALDLMLVYDWPGNVRQVANEIQRLIALTPTGGQIIEEMLSPLIRRGNQPGDGSKSSPASYYSGAFRKGAGGFSLDRLLSREALIQQPETKSTVQQFTPGQTIAAAVGELEKQMLNDAITRHRGNLRAVARELDLSPRGLYLKLERYQIKVNRSELQRL